MVYGLTVVSSKKKRTWFEFHCNGVFAISQFLFIASEKQVFQKILSEINRFSA